MGEILITGPAALQAVQRLTSNDAARLRDGQAQYSALTTERGTPVDDILVYRLAEDRFLLVVNAANDDKDFAWVSSHLLSGAHADHASDRYAQIALQGPAASAVLPRVTSDPVRDLASFAFLQGKVAGREALIARTGYTGEDGYDIYCAPGDASDRIISEHSYRLARSLVTSSYTNFFR